MKATYILILILSFLIGGTLGFISNCLISKPDVITLNGEQIIFDEETKGGTEKQTSSGGIYYERHANGNAANGLKPMTLSPNGALSEQGTSSPWWVEMGTAIYNFLINSFWTIVVILIVVALIWAALYVLSIVPSTAVIFAPILTMFSTFIKSLLPIIGGIWIAIGSWLKMSKFDQNYVNLINNDSTWTADQKAKIIAQYESVDAP